MQLSHILEKLLESAQENRKELEEIQERYNKIRKQLLAHSFTFGPAIETLENPTRQASFGSRFPAV